MKFKQNDIELSNQPEEAEENMPASSNGSGHFPFKEKIASSNLVAGTDNDWYVQKIGNGDFNVIKTTVAICGRDYNRLSLQT